MLGVNLFNRCRSNVRVGDLGIPVLKMVRKEKRGPGRAMTECENEVVQWKVCMMAIDWNDAVGGATSPVGSSSHVSRALNKPAPVGSLPTASGGLTGF